jgi:diguanylate cyclase (GGDEF)-like protein
MNTIRDTLGDLRHLLFDPPDAVMQDIGASGEVLWAQLRRLICAILMLLPLNNAATGGSAAETIIGLVFTGCALLASQGFLVLARQHRRLPWLPFVSAMYDVSTISAMLLILAQTEPAAGLNSMVVWACYPLSMLSSTLRNDVRVTLFAGVLAMAQFGAIVAWYMLGDHPLPVSVQYGTVTWSNELERLVLLFASALLCAMLALRMQKMVMISGTDGLTGLPNRSYLNLRVPNLVAEARTGERSLCLALIDLDHFKRINEEFGYLVGDRALRHTADTLRLELNRSEPLIRVGGEEFVLILDKPIGAAWEYVDWLRRKLSANPFDTEPGMAPRTISFSAGLAACPQDAADLSSLLRCADQRLRAAKLAGRNRVAARDVA